MIQKYMDDSISIVNNSEKEYKCILDGRRFEEEYGISRNTIKHYLCEYLAFTDIRALAPKKREEKVLTDDEKNMV